MFFNYYKGKKILVTGHTGFKGSWLSQWLLDLGAVVGGISIDIPTNPSNFEVLGLKDRLKHYAGDIRDLKMLKKTFTDFNPEVVFHLAAQSLVRTSYDDPKRTFDTNLGGTVNMLEAIRQTPSVKNVIIITSDKCYENVEWEWGYRENDRLGGKDPYSASKACAEIAARAYVQSFFTETSGVNVVTTRAGNVIGGGDWAVGRIVPDCIKAWSTNEKPKIRSPFSTRPWQHVLEPLSGYLSLGAIMAQDAKALRGESFNFGPSADVNQPVSALIGQMMETWQGCGWEDISSSSVSGIKKEATLLKLNCDKALQRLKWLPTMTFREGVNMTAEWYRAFYFNKNEMKTFTVDQIRQYESLASERHRQWVL